MKGDIGKMLEDVIEKMAFSICFSSCGNLPFII
jgi:hypothetical protein